MDGGLPSRAKACTLLGVNLSFAVALSNHILLGPYYYHIKGTVITLVPTLREPNWTANTDEVVTYLPQCIFDLQCETDQISQQRLQRSEVDLPTNVHSTSAFSDHRTASSGLRGRSMRHIA